MILLLQHDMTSKMSLRPWVSLQVCVCVCVCVCVLSFALCRQAHFKLPLSKHTESSKYELPMVYSSFSLWIPVGHQRKQKNMHSVCRNSCENIVGFCSQLSSISASYPGPQCTSQHLLPESSGEGERSHPKRGPRTEFFLCFWERNHLHF